MHRFGDVPCEYLYFLKESGYC